MEARMVGGLLFDEMPDVFGTSFLSKCPYFIYALRQVPYADGTVARSCAYDVPLKIYDNEVGAVLSGYLQSDPVVGQKAG